MPRANRGGWKTCSRRVLIGPPPSPAHLPTAGIRRKRSRMGLLDEWTRRAIQRRDGKPEFLGEQSGAVDDLLKRDLILEFSTRPDIRRAYLAAVAFRPENELVDALCLVSRRPDDKSLVIRIAELVRRRRGNDAVLDVLFLKVDEESQLASVCRPFYSSAL